MRLVRVLTKSGYVIKKAFYWNEIQLKRTLPIVIGKHNKRYISEPAYFDTETSHIDDTTQWVYQWAFLWGNLCVIGRRASEFIIFMRYLVDTYDLKEDKRLLIYVHNLAYDWSNLESRLVEEFDIDKEFLTDVHKPLTCVYSGLEFRCSYRLCGYGLEKFSEIYAKNYIKAAGSIDYNIVHYPDEELPELNWEYMLSDVYGLKDAVENYTIIKGVKNIFFNELTKTGYVRKAYRKASRKAKGWRKKFYNDYRLSVPQLQLFKEAFMGGYTHGNRYYSGEIIKGKVGHRDFVSSYPDKMEKRYVPSGSLNYFAEVTKLEEVRPLMDNYCVITRVAFQGLELKKEMSMPYLALHKCREFKRSDTLADNGKILCSNYLETTITELDFFIIEKLYTWKHVTFFDVNYCRRDLLPDWFRDTCHSYYKNKTELKDVEGREVEYANEKENLNSGYGMCATFPVHDEIVRTGSEFDTIVATDWEEQLNKFYESKTAFLPYQWGVYITAWARFELFRCILMIPQEDVLYCDTDSIFYKSTPKNEKVFDDYNKEVLKETEALGLVECDKNGKPHYLGGFTEEGEEIREFKFLHSKCYGFIGKKGLKIVVAGVTANTLIWKEQQAFLRKREEELGSLENLKDGFTFEECGGNRAVYVQRPNETIEVNGHLVEVGNSCIILPVSKTLSDLPEVNPETGLPVIFDTM